MLAFRAKTERGCALISAAVHPEFLFFRYMNIAERFAPSSKRGIPCAGADFFGIFIFPKHQGYHVP